MKNWLLTPFMLLISCCTFSCSSENLDTSNNNITKDQPEEINLPNKNISYLALGDSYTIGQSVCETCRFPEQLKSSLAATFVNTNFSLNIIAKTGWTTTNLLNAIANEKPENNFNLVTLLIGVNNQYKGLSFTIYEKEFPELVTKSIELAQGNKKQVIVISIPDYAYTKQGEILGLQTKISKEIDQYNSFAKKYCEVNGIEFVSITDITRNGLKEPSLVATDGLHPSESAYNLFVERMYPTIVKALKN